MAIWDISEAPACGAVKWSVGSFREWPQWISMVWLGFVRLGLGCTEVKLLTGSQNLNIPQIMKCRPQVSLLSSKGGNTGGVRICTREQHETATVFTCFHSLSRTGRERERERETHTHTAHTKICWDTAVTNDTYFAMKIGSPFDGWAAINRRSQMLPKQMKEMLGCRRWA